MTEGNELSAGEVIQELRLFTSTLFCAMLLLLTGCSSTGKVRSMSDARLLQELDSRSHQLRYFWYDAMPTWIEADGHGYGGKEALRIRGGSLSPALWELKQRAKQRPSIVLPLMNSDDPDAVITAMYMLPTSKLAEPSVVEVLRRQFFNHEDARIRWYALHILVLNHLLDYEVFDQALSDSSIAVRQAALLYNPSYGGAVHSKYRAVEVLIKHLTNDYPVARGNVSHMLRSAVGRGPPGIAERFDWVRESWSKREEMQQLWRSWWLEQADRELARTE